MQFLSFTADGLNTPLTANYSASTGCRAVPDEDLLRHLSAIQNPKREYYYSSFSFDENSLEKAKNAVIFKSFKGFHKLSMDVLPFDFDNKDDPLLAKEEALTFIKAYIPSGVPYALFDSGLKGVHLYIPSIALGSLLQPSLTLAADIKRFVTKLSDEFKTVDTSVYDIVRKFRAPGSMHAVSKKPKTLIAGSWPLELVPGTDCPKCDDLIQLFIEAQFYKTPAPTTRQALTPEVHDAEEGDRDFLSDMRDLKDKPCTVSMLSKDAPSGTRHHTFLMAVTDLWNQGLRDDDIRTRVNAWMQSNNPEERLKELESHLRDLGAGTCRVQYSCSDKVRDSHCSAKCALYPRLSAATLQKKTIPSDANQSQETKAAAKDAAKKVKELENVMGRHQLALGIVASENIITVAETEQFYAFDGFKYSLKKPLYFTRIVEKAWLAKSNNKINSEIIGKIKRYSAMENEPLLASTTGFINFKNGHFNKKTGLLEPRDPKRFFVYCLPFDYDPRATAPRFLTFLDEITSSAVRGTGGDKQCQALLLEYFGSTMSGDRPLEHKALFMLGEGRNGKSAFQKIVEHMLGDGNCWHLSLEHLANQDKRAGLEHVLANIVGEESPKAFREHSEALKAITAGDSLSARFLHQQSYEIKIKAKIWLSGNNAPDTSDTSHGFYSRLMVVPMEARILDQQEEQAIRAARDGSLPVGFFPMDNAVNDALELEASGIFNLAWDAYKIAKARGSFTVPEVVNQAKQELMDDGSLVQTIIKDAFYVLGPEGGAPGGKGNLTDWIQTKDALKKFNEKAKDYKWNYALDQKKFNKEVERAFPGRVRKWRCEKGTVHFIGLVATIQDTNISVSNNYSDVGF